MKGKSHLIVGGTAGYLISQQLDVSTYTTVGLTMLGSILVDIDEPSSKINKLLFFVSRKYVNYVKAIIGGIMLTKDILAIQYIGAIFLLSIVSSKTEYRFQFFKGLEKREYHRTLFHDPLIGGLIFIYPMFLLKLPLEMMIPLITGIALHYLCDIFTSYGLPLYIFRTKIRSPLHFKSGNGFAENLTVITMIIGMFILNNKGVIDKAINIINKYQG